jgi:hypothetical protein
MREGGLPNAPLKWLGGYSTTYTYLGDYQARLLGMGHFLPNHRWPAWIHTQADGARQTRGGASRYDRDFRRWG